MNLYRSRWCDTTSALSHSPGLWTFDGGEPSPKSTGIRSGRSSRRLSPPPTATLNRLFLTKAEAERLAEQVRQELVCRTADQADDLVMVADISLAVAEAWRLVDKLEDSLTDAEVDWQREGF